MASIGLIHLSSVNTRILHKCKYYSSHLVGDEGLAGGTSSSRISSVDFFLTWVFHNFTSCGAYVSDIGDDIGCGELVDPKLVVPLASKWGEGQANQPS